MQILQNEVHQILQPLGGPTSTAWFQVQPESTEIEQHPLQTVQRKVWTFLLAVFCHSLVGFSPSLLDLLALEIHPPPLSEVLA